MPVSSEFISLCRSQVTLLTQGLGAALSIVYLTERLVEEGTAQDKLIPVVAYPETAIVWEGSDALSLLPAEMGNNSVPRLLSEPTPETASVTVPVSLAEFLRMLRMSINQKSQIAP